jgi:hypothetical protein
MSEPDVQFVIHVAKPDGGEHYIDEFHGFTTKLVPVFGEISLMSAELHSNQDTTVQSLKPPEPVASAELRKRCFVLIKHIESMINEKNHKFHTAIQPSITPNDRCSFTFLNEAYHHFFFHYDATPLLVVETSQFDSDASDEALDDLIKQIRAMGPGTRYYVPRTK